MGTLKRIPEHKQPFVKAKLKAWLKANPKPPVRRRVAPIHCPHCRSWVEVRLNPVRLHCTSCGVEAKP